MDVIGSRNLRDLLEEQAALAPEKMFLTCENSAGKVQRLTYAGFETLVRRVAAGLAERGVRKGSVVLLQLANGPEFLSSWFALTWLGAVAVPINTASREREVAFMFASSGALGVITSLEHQALYRALSPGFLIVAGAHGQDRFDALLHHGEQPPRTGVDPEDLAQLIFTSGTTARPKAVMLTHANCLQSGERESRAQGIDDADRLLTALPAFHVNAQSLTILPAMTVCATVILLEQYRASTFWRQVRTYQATQVSLVAMQLRTLLAQPLEADERSHQVRRCLYAINVSEAEKMEFERRFGLSLINCYGLTEAMTVVAMAPVYGDRRWPSVGLPTRNVRILDERGQPVAPGVTGEIVVGGTPGRTLMKGYLNDRPATDAAVRDGELRTGDAGYLDDKGYLYLVDRLKDIIKRAGENVSPAEVEAILLEHPAVADAAVIGVPDPIRDEAVVAYVVLRPPVQADSAKLVEHCRAHLAPFKVPTRIKFLAQLPKTSVGKIEKRQLRACPPETNL